MKQNRSLTWPRLWRVALAVSVLAIVGVVGVHAGVALIPESWPAPVRFVILMVLVLPAVIYTILRLPRWVPVPPVPHHDPRKAALVSRLRLAGLFICLGFPILEPPQPLVWAAWAGAGVLLLWTSWAMFDADPEHDRAVEDELYKHHALLADRLTLRIVLYALMLVMFLTWGDWLGIEPVKLIVGLAYVVLIGRELAFVWYEWRADG